MPIRLIRYALLGVLWLSLGVSLKAADLPAGLPTHVGVGLADAPGGAAALKACAPFSYRYQYLAGGVNTGSGWQTWQETTVPAGEFANRYIVESAAQGQVPVFTYYMLLQTNPGTGADEQARVLGNFANAATMAAWFADLKVFFQQAHRSPGTTVVLHVEPDFWGYVEQRATNRTDPTSVPGQVAGSGFAEVAGYADNAAGLAQAIVHLRDLHAPNVRLGYHASVWGTNTDILVSKPSDTEVQRLANLAGDFYLNLHAAFDLVFMEFSDRDSAYHELVNHRGQAWYGAEDYRRHRLFLSTLVTRTSRPVVLWQIPLGNNVMRSCNNTAHHYQSNQVEWLLGDLGSTHLADYRQAGVIAFLFGAGDGNGTTATDAGSDGITNPATATSPQSTATAVNDGTAATATAGSAPAFDPATRTLTTPYAANDDGGYFRWRAWAYYQQGALPLTGAGPAAPVISSALVATGIVGTAFTYTITGSNTPTTYNATGLPVGLTVNTTTGVISGFPTVFGISSIAISATNATGTGTATLVLTVMAVERPPPAPAAGGGGGSKCGFGAGLSLIGLTILAWMRGRRHS